MPLRIHLESPELVPHRGLCQGNRVSSAQATLWRAECSLRTHPEGRRTRCVYHVLLHSQSCQSHFMTHDCQLWSRVTHKECLRTAAPPSHLSTLLKSPPCPGLERYPPSPKTVRQRHAAVLPHLACHDWGPLRVWAFLKADEKLRTIKPPC